MTVEEAKAKNEYIEKDTVKYAIGIPEEVFEKALNEFIDPGAHDCVDLDLESTAELNAR